MSWVGSAFGLSIRSEFELPGLEQTPGDAGSGEGRQLDLELSAGPQTPDVGWGERLQEWRPPGGPIGLAIDRNERRGYRFYVRDVGVFELSADGSRAVSRPAPDSAWHWRRYLTGQVLPFAALLQGLEVFHASAVVVEGGAVAIAGASGLGKSTLALNMHLAGAGFLADDVAAVERQGQAIVVHPGIAAAKIRRQARDLIAADRRGILGNAVDENEHEVRYELRRAPDPLPLTAVCLLEPSPDGTIVEPIEEDPEPWRLVGSTFNHLLQDPQRLRAQLDVCAAIAAQARFLHVRVPARPGPQAAARLGDALSGS